MFKQGQQHNKDKSQTPYIIWGSYIRELRTQLGYVKGEDISVDEFIRLISIALIDSEISPDCTQLRYYESGKKCPVKFQKHLELILAYVKVGAITTVGQANEWLYLADRRYLTKEEIQRIFNK